MSTFINTKLEHVGTHEQSKILSDTWLAPLPCLLPHQLERMQLLLPPPVYINPYLNIFFYIKIFITSIEELFKNIHYNN